MVSARSILDKARKLPEKATLLCLSPISRYVVQAYIEVAKELNTPICFAASLNQVDKDGGYTGWTPKDFKNFVMDIAKKYSISTPIILQLDHGGPWLKDEHIARNYSYEEALNDFLKSLELFIEANFNVIHIDTTVDIGNRDGYADVEIASKRTADIVIYSEEIASRYGVELEYEIGSDRWGYKPVEVVENFISKTVSILKNRGFDVNRLVFGVADVGTKVCPGNKVDPTIVKEFSMLMRRYGLYLKIHSGDYIENLGELPRNSVGGVNIGPMFAHIMYSVVKEVLYEKLGGDRSSELLQELNNFIAGSDKLSKYVGKGLGEVEEYKLGLASRYIWSTTKAKEFIDKISKITGVDIEKLFIKRLTQTVKRYVVELNLHKLYVYQ
jgi:hypothetical protein